jgi:thioredoxin reductase
MNIDVVIADGGAAGLSAAFIQDRQVLLCDNGQPRNWASQASPWPAGTFPRRSPARIDSVPRRFRVVAALGKGLALWKPGFRQEKGP